MIKGEDCRGEKWQETETSEGGWELRTETEDGHLGFDATMTDDFGGNCSARQAERRILFTCADRPRRTRDVVAPLSAAYVRVHRRVAPHLGFGNPEGKKRVVRSCKRRDRNRKIKRKYRNRASLPPKCPRVARTCDRRFESNMDERKSGGRGTSRVTARRRRLMSATFMTSFRGRRQNLSDLR